MLPEPGSVHGRGDREGNHVFTLRDAKATVPEQKAPGSTAGAGQDEEVGAIVGLAVGTLWDGRVRVWSGTRYRTKTSTAAHAPWTDWTEDADQPGDVVCAAPTAGGNLNVYSNGATPEPGQPGLPRSEALVLFQEVPYGGDDVTGWSPWPDTPIGYAVAAGGVLGGQLSTLDPEFTESDSASWLWVWTPDGGLLTSAFSGGGALDWTVFPPGSAGGGVLWNLYGPNDTSLGLTEGMLWHAPAINAEPDGEQPYLSLAVSTYPFATAPSSFDGAATNWTAWRAFARLPSGTGGVASLAACLLPEGNIQVFASDANGGLWTIWQRPAESGDPANWVWPEGWEKFPLPGGYGMPFLRPGNTDWSPASLERNALALAQLAPGGLQLFALDENDAVWTTFKTSTEPGASWSRWERF